MATSNSTNTPQLTANGQIIIGSAGANPVAGTIGAGTNIVVTNTAGAISVATASDVVTGPMVTVAGNIAVWNNTTGNQLAESGVSIDSSGDINTTGNINIGGTMSVTGAASFTIPIIAPNIPVTGDAVGGPSSTTNTAIATWNGTGGNELNNTGVTIDGSNDLTVPGHVAIKGASNLQLYNSANTAYTGLSAYPTVAGTITYTLPATAPTVNGALMSSSTAGNMSWSTVYEDSSGDLWVPGALTITNGNQVSLTNTANTHSVSISASSATATVNYTLPTTAPASANAVMSCGTTGTMTWTGVTIDGSNNVIAPGNVSIENQAALRLYNLTNSYYTAFYSNAASNALYELPTALPASNNSALVSNTSGAMSWAVIPTTTVGGPGSSTNTAIALWNGTTGSVLENSLVTIDGSGSIYIAGDATINSGNALIFNNTADTHYAAFTAGSGLSGNIIYTVPGAPTANNQVMTSYTDGVMVWSSVTIDGSGNIVTPGMLSVSANVSIYNEAGLYMYNAANTHYTGFYANPSANILYEWPPAPTANNQIMTSTAGGTMTWSTVTADGSGNIVAPGNITMKSAGVLYMYNSANTYYVGIDAGGATSNIVYEWPFGAPTYQNSALCSAPMGGMNWFPIQTTIVNNSSTVTLAPFITYLNQVTAVFTLPATANQGDIIRIVGNGGSWKIAQNAGNNILVQLVGSSTFTGTTAGTGGSISSTSIVTAIELIASQTSSDWIVISYTGELTIV